MPHPNLVPVIPSTSRSTQSNAVSPSTSTERDDPLILILKVKVSSSGIEQAPTKGSIAAAPYYVAELSERRRAAKVIYPSNQDTASMAVRAFQSSKAIGGISNRSVVFVYQAPSIRPMRSSLPASIC